MTHGCRGGDAKLDRHPTWPSSTPFSPQLAEPHCFNCQLPGPEGKGQPGCQGVHSPLPDRSMLLSLLPHHWPWPLAPGHILGRNRRLVCSQLPVPKAQAFILPCPKEGLAAGGGMGLQGEKQAAVAQHHPRPLGEENEPFHMYSLHPPHFLCSWRCVVGAPPAW